MATANSWDQAKELADKHKGSGDYVSLSNDGDSFVGVFLGEPFAYETVWNEKEEKSEVYDPAKHAGETPSLKVAINVFVIKEKGEKCNKLKIYEMSTKTFQQVIACREKYGLDNWSFEVKRNGAKGNTKTTYSVLPEEKLEDAQKSALAEIELNDLDKKTNNRDDKGSKGGGDKKGGGDEAEKAIEETKAMQLVARLKTLPREKLDVFLSKFGVKRVRDLKASQAADADAFLASLAEPAEEPKAKEEVDPFA